MVGPQNATHVDIVCLADASACRSLSLPHRTQILYLPDIAYISAYLDIKPGTKVIEAGKFEAAHAHAAVVTSSSFIRYRFWVVLAFFSSYGGRVRESLLLRIPRTPL